MAEPVDPVTLAGDFPPVDRAAWAARAGDVDALATTTYDGIRVEPLYTRDDAPPERARPGTAPFIRGRTAVDGRANGWDVRQVVDARIDPSPALEELERGATSLLIRLREVPDVPAAVSRVLAGVQLDLAAVVLDAGNRWPEGAAALAERWPPGPLHRSSSLLGADAAPMAGSLGADPFGEWASDHDTDVDGQLIEVSTWASRLAASHPEMRTVTIDGTRFHDAGASDAQELGLALAVVVATLRSLVEADRGALDIDTAFSQIEVRLAATAEQFATIAKFRAARRLLARVAEIAGNASAAGRVPLHAVTSAAMMTRYDPSVNTLRGTVACFAAGVAGADAVTVLPFDEFVGEAVSERGRRLARNTQSVLAMESHLASVVDPAGGSWYVERRTDDVAAAAWATFQQVERTGGFRAAVVAGVVDEALATTRAARQGDLDHRRRPITGVSEFPNIAEPPAPPWPNRPTAARGADGLAEGVSGVHCGGLSRRRWAEGFESLRQRVDAATGTGERPIVMLATLGRPAAFTARAMFAQNFFAVAGVGTRSGPISDNVVEVANAFTEALGAGAGAVCICSSDAVYAVQGAALAKALTAAGASRVYLVGPPGDQLGELREAGVTHTIAAGDDARAALADLVDHLGIP